MINYDQQSGYSVSSVRLSLAGNPHTLPAANGHNGSQPTSAVTANGIRHSQRNGGGLSDYASVLATTSNLLTIDAVGGRHAGNYTCAPSNARPISVNVHVLQGDRPAAMQHGNRSAIGSAGGSSRSGGDPKVDLWSFLCAYAMVRVFVTAPLA